MWSQGTIVGRCVRDLVSTLDGAIKSNFSILRKLKFVKIPSLISVFLYLFGEFLGMHLRKMHTTFPKKFNA